MLVLLGGYVYGIFHQFQKQYELRVDQTYDAALVQSMIQKDVSRSRDYTQVNETQLCIEAKHFHVCYSLTDSFLIRSFDTQVDTLFFQGQWQAFDRQRFRLHDQIHQISYSFSLPKRATYERN